jgi:hypothetical protein
VSLTISGEPEPPKATRQAQVAQVFACWIAACTELEGRPCRRKLDNGRRRVIERALDMGYSTADLCLAADGWMYSPWHCGKNAEGRTWNELTLILRDAQHIDQFIELAEQNSAVG